MRFEMPHVSGLPNRPAVPDRRLSQLQLNRNARMGWVLPQGMISPCVKQPWNPVAVAGLMPGLTSVTLNPWTTTYLNLGGPTGNPFAYDREIRPAPNPA